jgi:diadenosine tetraphosphate (Ap4A) HIT family hydrolase
MGSQAGDCSYCARDERLEKILIEVCRLQVSTLFLFREQTYRGRCVVALDRHEREVFHLDDETLCALSRDVSRAAAALQRAFGPDKINYAVYGDLVPHLHFHLVPKYRGGPEWGQPFVLHPPAQRHLTDAENRELVAEIARQLSP